MKIKFLAILAAVALALPAFSAQYESYTTVTLISGGTNNVAAGAAGVAATNLYTGIGPIRTPYSEYLPLQISYNFHAAPVGTLPTVLFKFQRSVDGSNWESHTNLLTLTVSPVVTNSIVWVTNLTVAGYANLRLHSVENTNSAVLTNLTVKYGIKR